MKKQFTFLILSIIFLFILIISSCRPYLHQPMQYSEARLGPETSLHKDLTSLPDPEQRIVAAVYKFRDQTGQYKPSEIGSSWSTAITQGATTILIRALEESKWFIPIERENIGNLMNERKIIRSSKAQYSRANNQKESLLPPLLFAGVILEGGIISYEANVLTGGAGIRYFGAGVSGEYREDRVTIYLRAVSTSNGKILKTVYTTKSILSQKVDVGFFRYVKFKRLLEFETGFTYNEPSEMAVTEAIEKAVQSLIIEGVYDELWKLKDAADTTSVALVNYLEEKENNTRIDHLGRAVPDDLRGKFNFGINGGARIFEGDYKGTPEKAFGELELGYALNKQLSVSLNVSHGTFAADKSAGEYFESTYNSAQLNLKYLFLGHDKVTPLLYVGGGLLAEDKSESDFSTKSANIHVGAGFGFEYMLAKQFGISITGHSNYLFDDKYDGLDRGKYNDFYYGGTIGLNYYFGKPRKK